MLTNDRREHERIAVEIDVAWTIVGQRVSGTGTLLNVGLGGACLRIEQPFTPAEDAILILHASVVPEMPRRARLRWSKIAMRPRMLLCGLVFEDPFTPAWRAWLDRSGGGASDEPPDTTQ